MKGRIAVLVVALFTHLAPAAATPESIRNARIEAVSGITPLEALARTGRGGDPQWVGWSVKAIPHAGEPCCFTKNFRPSACSLADRDWSWGTSGDSKRSSATEIYVLVKIQKGQATGVRMVAPSCEVDGARRHLLWIGAVDPAASVSTLGRLLDAASSEDVAEPALAAIAHHDDPAADAVLERRALDRSLDVEVRKQALFWAGNVRGEPGYRLLDRVLASESDGEIREHALFALTQSEVPRAIDRVKETAVKDKDGHVRGQALFWLAQAGVPGAGEWILGRLDAERDPDVREQAVFALSQLPDGTDWLLSVLRSKRDPETIRRALFWLGQSDDPRALAEIEKILER